MEILSASELDFSPARTCPGPDFQGHEQFSKTPVVQMHHHMAVLVVRQHCMKEQVRERSWKTLNPGQASNPLPPRLALFQL